MLNPGKILVGDREEEVIDGAVQEVQAQHLPVKELRNSAEVLLWQERKVFKRAWYKILIYAAAESLQHKLLPVVFHVKLRIVCRLVDAVCLVKCVCA